MYHEVAISFRSRLKGVSVVDPAAPLAPVPPQPGIKEQANDREIQLQEERTAIQSVLSGITNALQTVQAREQQRLAEMRQVAVELAVAIASRLTHVHIQAGDFGIEAIVREVVDQLSQKQPATAYLHPADIALLERRIEANQSLLPVHEHVRLGADPTLGRGECRAEFGEVSIWSQWQSQLPEIHQHLLRSIPDARAGHHEAQT